MSVQQLVLTVRVSIVFTVRPGGGNSFLALRTAFAPFLTVMRVVVGGWRSCCRSGAAVVAVVVARFRTLAPPRKAKLLQSRLAVGPQLSFVI